MWNPAESDFNTWIRNNFCKCEEDLSDTPNQGDPVLPMVIADLEARAADGRLKYNNEYCVNTRDDPLWECYEEILDCAMYLRAELERRGK